MYIVKNCLLKKGDKCTDFSKAYIKDEVMPISKVNLNQTIYPLGDLSTADISEELEIEKTISAPINYMELKASCKQNQYEGYNVLMFPYSGLPNKNGGATTIEGITYTITKDGEITLNGEATNDSVFFLVSTSKKILLDAGETYTFSGINKKDSSSHYYMGIQEVNYKEAWTTRTNYINFTPVYQEYYIYIKVIKGSILEGEKIKPLLIKGNALKEFEPYVGCRPSPSKEYKHKTKNTMIMITATTQKANHQPPRRRAYPNE